MLEWISTWTIYEVSKCLTAPFFN